MNFEQTFRCAFCGEENDLFIEPEHGDRQSIVEDCFVCCRPNVVKIRIDGEHVTIESEGEG